MRRAVAAIVLFGVAACGAPQQTTSVHADTAQEKAFRVADTAAPANEPPRAEDPSPAALLAYVYAVGLELPADKVRPTVSAHEAACREAGPRTCLVIGSSVSASGSDAVFGNLSIRAEPEWLARFRAELAGQARTAGGRIVEESVSAEDLTRVIVDTSARLEAQKTLRDRLREILRNRPAKVSDLLETERELARVQGEIDSAQSQLAVMRQRVDMSELNLSYATKPTAVSGSAAQPIVDAVTNFFAVLATGIAAIITTAAFLLPFALVLGPLVWWLLRWRAKRRAGTPAPSATE
jgi:hypothetical protein